VLFFEKVKKTKTRGDFSRLFFWCTSDISQLLEGFSSNRLCEETQKLMHI